MECFPQKSVSRWDKNGGNEIENSISSIFFPPFFSSISCHAKLLLSEHKNPRADFDGQEMDKREIGFFLDWKNKVEGFPPLSLPSPVDKKKRKKKFRTVRDAYGPPLFFSTSRRE